MISETSKKIKIGIVANEFFDEKIGGFGGFGWLAREAVFSLKKSNTQSIDTVFLSGNFGDGLEGKTSFGVRVIFPEEIWPEYTKKVQQENIDVLLTIDYRPNYDYPIAALPNTPLIVWIQDPRPLEDIKKVNSLRIPGSLSTLAYGIDPIDCTPLTEVVLKAISANRSITYASPAPQLIDKVEGTYGLSLQPSQIEFLPYPLDIDPGKIQKVEHPRVVYLGRLDPIKRPWVFVELARLFPEVEFCLLGKAHFQGEGAWNPVDTPANVRFLGHVDGEEKRQLLQSAWILINSSIHEALPVSFLEALQYEMPIISCQNPENIVSKFGFYTGQFDGDGLAGLRKFAEGLKNLLKNPALRIQLGKNGRKWVEDNHTEAKFLATIEALCKNLEPDRNLTHNSVVPQPWGIPKEMYRSYQTIKTIREFVPEGETFTLIDENKLPSQKLETYSIIPFIEKEGNYYGPPENDQSAIFELEKQIKYGAKYLVVAYPAFWWLDYYKGWNNYLRNNFECIAELDYLKVFFWKHEKRI